MKTSHSRTWISISIIALFLLACSGEGPTAPAVQPPSGDTRMAMLFGNVYDVSGGCLNGAVVEIMDGARAGATVTQTQCQAPWDYGENGYSFRDLPPNVNVRIRASKAGYRAQEISVHAVTTGISQTNFVLRAE